MAHVAATFDQRTYRFRNDDGTESGATWKDAENTPITQPTGEVFRLRVAVQETAGGSANNRTIVLQSNVNGAGWEVVDANAPRVRLSQSPHVDDQTPTTRQLTGTSGDFLPGLLLTETSGTDISFAGNEHTEVEWASLLITGEVPDQATVQFRVTINGEEADTVTAAPSLTAEAAAEQHESGGSDAAVNVTATGGGTVPGFFVDVTTATTATFSHTVADDADRILLVSVVIRDEGVVTGITFNGSPLTFIAEQVGTAGATARRSTWLYGMVDPPATTADIVVSTDGSVANIAVAASNYKDVSAWADPAADGKRGDDEPLEISVDVPSDDGDFVVDTLGYRSTAGEEPGEGQTLRWTVDGGSSTGNLGSTKPASSPTTQMLWTWESSIAADVALIGVALEPATVEAQHEAGGSDAAVTVSSEGSGQPLEDAAGGADTTILVAAEGAGTAAEHPADGSDATVVVTSEGAGTAFATAEDGADAAVTITASGGGQAEGQQAEFGGSDAVILVTSEGAGDGFETAEDGSNSIVTVTATGAGAAEGEQHEQSGADAAVTVIATGEGEAAEHPADGSDATVTVTAEGDGTAQEHLSGGSDATVIIIATGTEQVSGGIRVDIGPAGLSHDVSGPAHVTVTVAGPNSIRDTHGPAGVREIEGAGV